MAQGNAVASIQYSVTDLADDHNTISGLGGGAGAHVYNDHGNVVGSVDVSLGQIVQTYAYAVSDPFAAPGEIYFGGGSGSLSYYLTVNGPSNVDVPLSLSGYGLATRSQSHDGAGSESRIGFGLDSYNALTSGADFAIADCSINTPGQCGALNFSTAFTLKAYTNPGNGRTARITLYSSSRADAENVGFGESVGTAYSFIDPTIVIDPTFLSANPGYSLTLSPGVTQPSSAAPEPASWALMIIGLGAVGGVLRRKKRRAVTV